MLKDQLQKLKGVDSFPAISIVMPTHRKFPASKQNPTIMKNQLKKINELLSDQFDKRNTEHYMEKLKDLEEKVDYDHPLDSLGVFMSKDVEQIVYLPFSSRETAIVDSSFQIRDIVYTLNRSFNYNVILLSEKNTRIFHGMDDKVAEYFPKDLPKSVKEYVDEPLMDDNRYSYQDTNLFNENVRIKFYQDIDEFISKNLGKKNNLVLVGVADNLAEFQKLSKNKDKIYLTAEGNYDHFTEHEVSELIRPKILEKLEAEKKQMLGELEKAVSNGKYASGITQVWREVGMKKGHILFVEKGYYQPALKGDDELTIHTAEENDEQAAANPKYISDAVDDVVEKMLEDNGEVYFVEEGALEDHQKIAVITKY